jgi:lysyl-tRNA synthetase class 2
MTMNTPPEESPHRLEAQRRTNRDGIASLGLSPYGEGGISRELVTLAQAQARYDEAADADHKARGKEPGFIDKRPIVRVAGRALLVRDNGKLVWMKLRDASGDLQIAISQRDCAGRGFDLAKLTDLGDVLVASGPLVKTKAGEVTVWATSLHPGAKCLVSPPEKHAGLSDVELRYRQRYMDLWANPETMRVFQLRAAIVGNIRRLLDSRGFQEVETPMLQTLAGGAAARPFRTHMNALDIELFLRIAPELYLKRLLVGGMPRVYEVNRNFRNEGLDKQHNPEFTMLEAYEAFGDCASVMALTEDIVRSCAELVAQQSGASSLTLPFGDLSIDFGRAFDRVTYAELFERALGFSTTNEARVRAEIGNRHLARKIKGAKIAPGEDETKALARLDPILLINTLFEEVAEKSIDAARPTFITEYPAALSPLTRPKPGSPAIAERADLFIGHMEVAPHYTELNDPDVQEARFREQLSGIDDEEQTFRTFDEDFIRALRVGMPPAGGLGLGIDRLTMILTNQRTIRDVVLFPMMRPE